MSPARAGEECGLNKGTVSAWKQRGTQPSGRTLQKIADYFGVTTDYLLTGEEPYQAVSSSDEEVEIFEAINALKDTELRRLVLRLSTASQEEIRKVHGFLDLTQIGGSYGS